MNDISSQQSSQCDGSKNLNSSFETCEKFSQLRVDFTEPVREHSDALNALSLSDTFFDSSLLPNCSLPLTNEDKKCDTNCVKKAPTLFTSIEVNKVMNLSWPEVYEHKCLGI